jgi:hypothetical protein
MIWDSRINRTREELDFDLRALRLTERRFALVRQAVLLLVTVALAVTTIICALHGHDWSIATTTGGSSVGTAASSALGGGLRQRQRQRCSRLTAGNRQRITHRRMIPFAYVGRSKYVGTVNVDNRLREVAWPGV